MTKLLTPRRRQVLSFPFIGSVIDIHFPVRCHPFILLHTEEMVKLPLKCWLNLDAKAGALHYLDAELGGWLVACRWSIVVGHYWPGGQGTFADVRWDRQCHRPFASPNVEWRSCSPSAPLAKTFNPTQAFGNRHQVIDVLHAAGARQGPDCSYMAPGQQTVLLTEMIHNMVGQHGRPASSAASVERCREGEELYRDMKAAGPLTTPVMIFGQMNEPPGTLPGQVTRR